MTRKTRTPPRKATIDAAHQFLALYYPIHYRAGIGVEDALRGTELSRHQTAILWLIHSEGAGGREMSRKAIVNSLGRWFEISNAAITKALRSMSQAPLNLVHQREDPASGRQKVVTLTAKGEAHLATMIERGAAYVQMIVDGLTDEQVVNGIDFFQRITAIVDGWAGQPAAGDSRPGGEEHD